MPRTEMLSFYWDRATPVRVEGGRETFFALEQLEGP
jgi:hypothetical protein